MKRLEEYRKQVIFVADFYTPDSTISFKLFFLPVIAPVLLQEEA